MCYWALLCSVKLFWWFSVKSARDVLWWMALLGYPKPVHNISKAWVCSNFSQKPRCVAFMCVFSPVMGWEPVLLGPQKKAFPLCFNYHNKPSCRGSGRLRDSTVCFTPVSWRKVEQKRPIISEMHTYKPDFTFRFFLLKDLFHLPRCKPTTLKGYLIPHVSQLICAKFSCRKLPYSSAHCRCWCVSCRYFTFTEYEWAVFFRPMFWTAALLWLPCLSLEIKFISLVLSHTYKTGTILVILTLN